MGGAQSNTVVGVAWLNQSGMPGWRVAAVADMNRDGVPDLIWQNDTTRQVLVVYMAQDNTSTGSNWINQAGAPGWKVVAAGDLNRDGVPDIIWQNDTTRQVTVWYMGGAGGAVNLSWSWINQAGAPGWRVAALADLNQDGVPDIIWQNDATRQVTVWYMGGAGGAVNLYWSWINQAGAPGWTVSGSADLNQDGVPDIIWQNDATRQVTAWYMGGPAGSTNLSWSWLDSTGQAGWTVVAAR